MGGKGPLVGGGTGASIFTPSGRDKGGATGEDVLGGGGGTASVFGGA